MSTLQCWEKGGHIRLLHTRHIARELKNANTDPYRKAAKSRGRLFASSLSRQEEKEAKSIISNIVFPNGSRSMGDRFDVAILRIVQIYGAVLITDDGASKTQPRGILGARDELAKIGIRVMRDKEAKALAAELLRQRDRFELMAAARNGRPVADWVGRTNDAGAG